MNQVQTAIEWGLLANGASGSWSIEIDESHGGHDLNMQVDGPRAYLGFAIADLQVVSNLCNYLRDGLAAGNSNKARTADEGIFLGRLDSLSVSMIQDDETSTRWFIIIDGKAGAVVRFTLDALDVEAIVDALQQVMDDLPVGE